MFSFFTSKNGKNNAIKILVGLIKKINPSRNPTNKALFRERDFA